MSVLNALDSIVEQSIRHKENKIQAVRHAVGPTTKKQVKSFLGLAGFYRKLISNFSNIASPLTDLKKKQLKTPASVT